MAPILLVVVTLAALEGSARFALSRQSVFERVTGESDAWWRLSWIRRHRAGTEIYYSFDVYHQERGWTLKPGLRDADPFGLDSLNSNASGLRGTVEFSDEKPPGRTRVLLLGDSFTFGEEVSDAETFAQGLQRRLPRTEVMNLGVHGYGHDQMLLYLREAGPRYQPDLVVVGFVQDDMTRNMLEFRDFSKPRFELDGGGALTLRNVPVPTPDQVAARERFKPRLLDLLDMTTQAVLKETGINRRRMERLTAALLDEMVEEAAAAGAVTVFTYLPHSVELTDPASAPDGRRFFSEYCRSRAAFCLDLAPSFLDRIADGVPIKAAGHWHGHGHDIVASELARYLELRDLVPS